MNTYAATKAAADLAIGALAADGLHAIRLRLFNHTGAGQSEAFVVAAFARQIARIEAGLQAPELHVGRLDPARDFLDVADVCEAYVACLRRLDDLAADTVLNVASGTARRIGDILDGLLRLSGVKARVLQDPGRLRPGDISMALGDAGLARRLVGWQPRVPWERTLGDVLGDWRLRVG
jgi:GDP-4-dehydro-6-deoxy-D-mannose reductase